LEELIKIQKLQIGNDTELSVSARDLHSTLEVKTVFADWIKRRVNDAQLIKGQDFMIILKNENNSVGPPKKEYTITVDAAKHIAMMEKSQKGKQIREYFIQVEKEVRRQKPCVFDLPPQIEQKAAGCFMGWMQVASILEVPAHIAQFEAIKATKNKTGIDYTPLLLKAPAQNGIKKEEEMLEVSNLAKLINFEGGGKLGKGARLNKYLEFIGWQMKVNDQWISTEEGKKYSFTHSWHVGGKSGYNLKWNVSAVRKRLNR